MMDNQIDERLKRLEYVVRRLIPDDHPKRNALHDVLNGWHTAEVQEDREIYTEP